MPTFDPIEAARSAINLGLTGVLLIAVILLGWAILHLDKRSQAKHDEERESDRIEREKERTAEHNRYTMLHQHHVDFVEQVRVERQSVQNERSENRESLIVTIKESTIQNKSVEAALDQLNTLLSLTLKGLKPV